MTFFRHSTRFVHHTVAAYIKTQLATLDWTVAGSVPFGAPVVTFRESLPEEYEAIAKLEPGKVAITVGDEADSLEEELGGPLARQEIPIFIDIFMDNETHALALACDVRDILKGRFDGTVRFLPLLDYKDDSAGTPVDGWVIELEDVVRQRAEGRVNWQIVKVTAAVTFQEVQV